MLNKIKNLLTQPKSIFILFILLAIVAGVQKVALGAKDISGHLYTNYNNFIIFKNAHYHLVNHQNLYAWYPSEQWDLFKYTPTFATFFGFFTFFNNYAGVSLWNVLNTAVLLIGIYSIPQLQNNAKAKISLFILVELITSLQSQQTNALNAGLILLFFANMEKKNYFWGIFFIVLAFYSKMYPIAAGAIWFFYDNKIKNLLYGIFWLIVLGAVPLLFVNFEQLTWQYQNYLEMIKTDNAISYGLSVLNMILKTTGYECDRIGLAAIGFLMTISPLIWLKRYKNSQFRTIFLGNYLIFMIIFNHKAESPTFILAAVGVALWYFSQESNKLNLALLIFVFIFSWLAPTDIFPRFVRQNFFEAYSFKVFPCFLIWLKALYDLHFFEEKIVARAMNN